jgi:AcrR family transcriptional regulator
MSDQITPQRLPLTRHRVLEAAVAIVDRQGLAALTMRRLGAELDVEAMSVYKHVSNKDEILDGIIELVIGEIEIPAGGADWKDAMRRRARSARAVFGRHSWAIGLLEARGSKGPAAFRYVDAILGNLRLAGFSVDHAVHAFWLLDSFVYGHVIQETSYPAGTSEEMSDSTRSMLDQINPDEYPHLVEMGEHALRVDYSIDSEFEFGLDLILSALERVAEGETNTEPANQA